MAGELVFPAYTTIEHRPNPGAENAFKADVDKILAGGKKSLGEFAKQAKETLATALSVPRNDAGSLDLGVPQLQAAAAAQQRRATAAREVYEATIQAARAEGEYSAATRQSIAATKQLWTEEQQAADAAFAHAKAAQSAQAALNQQKSSVSSLHGDLLGLAQTEAAAANGAQLLAAIQRETGIALEGTARSARESAAAFELLFQAQEARSSVAAQGFFNTALGIDAQTKSARDSAHAFEELFAAQSALLTAQRQINGDFLQMAQAEAAAANGADMLEATYRGTALELDHVTKSARDSFAAFVELGHEQVRGTNVQGAVVNSVRASRQAYGQLGQQMQDMVVQAQSGTSALVIFTQQVPQASFALSGLRDSANKTEQGIGKFATFLSGPWGAAIFGATALLGPLIIKQLSFGDAVGDATDKLKENYEKTLINEKAQAAFALTLDGVRQALDANRKAQEQLNLVQDTAAEKTKKAADAARDHALAIRDMTVALLNQADAELRAAKNPSNYIDAPNPALAMQQGIANSQAYRDEIAKQLAKAKQELADAQAQITNANLAKVVEDANRTPQEKIKNSYDAQIDEAKRLATLAINGANTFIKNEDEKKLSIEATTAALKKQVDALVAARDAAIKAQRETSKGGPSASAQASLGDMVALIKQLFPGAQITATTNGKHTKGSDHYAGRAIDFVPAGGMGQYTSAEVEEILRNAGVDIRRNKNGTEQFFGPGRPADKPGDHDDHFHVAWQGQAPDPNKVAEATKKAEALLADFGLKAANSIAGINAQFDESPKLIDQALRATRQLDQTITELQDKKPIGWEQMVEDARAAQDTIQSALIRPIEQMREESERQQQVQDLLLHGREEEAAAVQAVWNLEARLGKEEDLRLQVQDLIAAGRKDEADALQHLLDLYPGLKRDAADIAASEVAANKQRQIALDMQQNYLQATQSIRSELEGMFQGDKLDLGKVFKELNAKVTVEKLFGPALRELDEYVKNGGVKSATDYFTDSTTQAGDAATKLAEVLTSASNAIRNPAALGSSAIPPPPPAPGEAAAWFAKYMPAGAFTPGLQGAGAAVGAALSSNNDNEIVVSGIRRGGVLDLNPQDYFERAAAAIAKPLLGPLEKIGGPEFAQALGGILAGVMYGQATAGTTGGILGGLKGIADSFAKSGNATATAASKILGQALGGAQTGTQVAAVAKALGINKFSTTGSQIGGAIGSFIPIPGGDIIGSIIGGTIGALFKKAKQTYADFGDGAVGEYTLGGGDKYTDQANSLGKSVLDGLTKITDAFGGELGQFALKIGVRNGEYMVDPTGNASFKYGVKFGDDSAAAIAYAIMDAIKDGALKGLSASIQNLLSKPGTDLDTQLQKALDMQGVFDKLRQIKDPIGYAVDAVEKEFDRLRDIFAEAGASAEELAQLEELYGIQRKEAAEEAMKQLTASLQSLLDDLTVNNSALSLKDREALAKAAYDPLAARVAAGDTTAYDDYADAARTLLDIERQIYGSQPEYFALLDQVTALTKTALSSATTTATTTTTTATDNANVVSAVEAGNSQLVAVNQNIIATNGLIAQLIARINGTTTSSDARVSGY